jgi:hypothetical protein
MVVRDIPNDPKVYLLKEDPINRIVDWLSKRGSRFPVPLDAVEELGKRL